MENSILQWLGSLGLSRPVRCLETEFASGFLFGEVLWRLKFIADFGNFQNSATPAAQVQNFTALQKELGRLGVKFSTAVMHNIIRGKPGAAAYILSQLKAKQRKNIHEAVQYASCTASLGSLNYDSSTAKPWSVSTTRKIPGLHCSPSSKNTVHELSALSSMAAIKGGSWRCEADSACRTNSPRGKLQGPGSMTPVSVRGASERADVLESIDTFEINLQRQGVCSPAAAIDAPYCSSTCGDVEQVLHMMSRKLPSMQTQKDYNARLMERLHGSRQAQEAACYERSRRRQRLLLEQAQKCKEVLDAHFTKTVAASSTHRSSQCLKLVSTVARTRQYEKVIRCNLEVKQLLLNEQENKRLAMQLRHEQHSISTRGVLTEAAIEEQARICRSVRTVRRALKRSRLIGDCEAMAEQIVDLVLEASDYKRRFDAPTIPPKVWREWLARFVLPENDLEFSMNNESYDATNSLILHLPVNPPAIRIAECCGERLPALLPPTLLSDFKEYSQAEGSWSVSYDAAKFPGLPPLPPLGEFLVTVIKAQDIMEGATAASQEQAAPLAGDAHGNAGVGGTPVEDVSPSLCEPQLEKLGQLVHSLLQQARPDPMPAKPVGAPEVALRIIVTGKPASGKHALATQLASRYKLEVLSLQSILHEALNAVSSVLENTSGANPSETAESGKEDVKPPLDAESSFASLGAEASRHLLAGSPIPDALAVRLLVAKLQKLFPPETRETREEQLRRLRQAEAEELQSARSSGTTSGTSKASVNKKSKNNKSSLGGDRGGTSQETAASDLPRCGWILVGFPTTMQQYALLEERLSGFIEAGRRLPQRLQVLKERSNLLVKMPEETKKQEESR